MKLQFSTPFAFFLTIFLVASLVIPLNLAMPFSASADPGIMKWDTVTTPGSLANNWDINNLHGAGADTGQGSEIIDMAAGGQNIAAIVRMWRPTDPALMAGGNYVNVILCSYNSGISFTETPYLLLLAAGPPMTANSNIFQVKLASDNPNFVVITTDNGAGSGPKQVWCLGNINTDQYAWSLVYDGAGLGAAETIRCIAVSDDYGGRRDIAFGTVNGIGGGRWAVISTSGFSALNVQLNANGIPANPPGASGIDYHAIKFSPNYAGDASVALVYSSGAVVPPGAGNLADSTYFNVALRDLQQNTTLDYAYGFTGVEVKNPTSTNGASPAWDQLNNVDLDLPSDFSGQASSLRRAYISLDAFNAPRAATTCEDGIYRIDDSTTYTLMDTTNTVDKAIYSIAYYGTYASGKLIAGERMGSPCGATVATWFTDSPTTCPIPCWYPALKPTTGAANQGTCSLNAKNGMGAALVAWNGDASMGLVATGSLAYTVYAGQPALNGGGLEGVGAAAVATAPGKGLWYQMQYWNAVNNDESAFAISRNNGETWNQIAIIDTTIDWFNDVAVAPDCTTIYLASVNRNTGNANFCNEFDSVWRSSINPNVTAPLPTIQPLGSYWERVYARTTSTNCATAQSDLPILRVVNSCTDKPDGEMVAWASQGSGSIAPAGTNGSGVMAWSPDYGDYWATISPRNVVQDFAFESGTTMFVVNPLGMVQRLPYSGTSWSTNLASSFSLMDLAHTIAAVPDGKVLVGAANGAQYPSSYSADKGVSWAQSPALAGHGNEHVIFDVDFKNNSFIYMGDDTAGNVMGSVYRNTAPSYTRWADSDMMQVINGGSYVFGPLPFGVPPAGSPLGWPAAPVSAGNPPHIVGQFGLVQAWTGAEPQGATTYGPALYSAHSTIQTSVNTAPVGSLVTPTMTDSAVCRTLVAHSGMPKPGVSWDCLDIFAPISTSGVRFTLEPSSLKACGCCTLDTNTTLYAIDNEAGGPNSTPGSAALSGRWWSAGVPLAAYTIGYAPFMGPQPAPTPAWGSGPQGMLWAYSDCLAKKGPVLKTPADKALVGADPVTGRNQQIDLGWEQLCLSTWYELQIGKDAAFTLRINPGQGGAGAGNSAGNIVATTGSILLQMDSVNMTSPAAWIAPGALPEAGAIYYWRIRSARSATLQIAASPWSEVRSFTIKAGFIVNTPYYGVQLLAPNNACSGCKVKPSSFSWSPWKEATKYQFDLATDPEFKSLVQTATTTGTGYEYSGTLNYSTNYFWRVKAIEVNGQDIPSDWSATFSFQTESAPAPPSPAAAEPPIPTWVWVLIAIGSILVIATLVLVFKTRRI